MSVRDEKFEELRRRWYRNESVQFNLIESLKFREGVFIRLPDDSGKSVTIRCCKMNAIRFMMMNFERFHFFDESFNLYASLAKYPNLPMFSFGHVKRREEMDEFNKAYISYCTEYDFLFDIDNTDLKIAYATAYKTKKIFDDAKVPYTLTFSGNKGFHIRVAFEDFSTEMQMLPKQELMLILKKFAERFAVINALHSIDLSIFDLRRIAKTPYSVVYPYYLIALPLSDEEMDNFSLQYCSMVHWLKPENQHKLYQRGLLKRAGTPQAFGDLVARYSND